MFFVLVLFLSYLIYYKPRVTYTTIDIAIDLQLQNLSHGFYETKISCHIKPELQIRSNEQSYKRSHFWTTSKSDVAVQVEIFCLTIFSITCHVFHHNTHEAKTGSSQKDPFGAAGLFYSDLVM